MKHTVTEDEENLRADKVIKNICGDVGYAFLQKLFRLGKIKVNGKKVAASGKLRSGDVVMIYAKLGPVPNDTPVFSKKLFDQLKSMIIFENENFFAINKPSGLAVQPGIKVSVCVETLIKSRPDCQCRLVHRLDKDTSGALLIAKNQKYARRLTEMFRENRIKKTYIAIVDGKISESGVLDNFMEKSFAGAEEKMRISDSGQRAITAYSPLKQVGEFTLLELKPFTGRKHQLRVHCADVLKTPILGDGKYNRNSRRGEMLLHAHKVFLEDFGIEIIADIPEYFHEIISKNRTA
ncbi:MAG: RluA family pseudouridine synthase [Holosporaceae bacterium]|jgi:23S rRNA pseudouridine955/2504/2580 synthase|nr:RluA family pseudouridine synthase [Holosporaceae bacterium]